MLYHLLPRRMAARYRELGRFGMLVLLAIFIFLPSVLHVVWWPLARLEEASEVLIRLWT